MTRLHTSGIRPLKTVSSTKGYRQTYDSGLGGELEMTLAVKYLPADLVKGDAATPTKIDDVYVAPLRDIERPRLKFRRVTKAGEGGNYLMITKDRVPMVDDETLPYIRKVAVGMTGSDFDAQRDAIMRTGIGRRVIKDRYRIEVDGLDGYLYVYQGSLYGLVTVSFKQLGRKQYLDLLDDHVADFLGPRSSSLEGCAVSGCKAKDLRLRLADLGCKLLDPSARGYRRYRAR